MIKFLSLLAISSSVFYSPSINAHSYGGTENHTKCRSGAWSDNGESGNGSGQFNSKHYYNSKSKSADSCY